MVVFGRLELVDRVRGALDDLEIGIVAEDIFIHAQTLEHAVDLDADREIGRLESDRGETVKAGSRSVPEVAERQGEAAAE